MKIIFLILILSGAVLAQTPANVPSLCPVNLVCLSPAKFAELEAGASKAAELSERVKKLEGELAAKSEELSTANAMTARLSSILDYLMKKVK